MPAGGLRGTGSQPLVGKVRPLEVELLVGLVLVDEWLVVRAVEDSVELELELELELLEVVFELELELVVVDSVLAPVLETVETSVVVSDS